MIHRSCDLSGCSCLIWDLPACCGCLPVAMSLAMSHHRMCFAAYWEEKMRSLQSQRGERSWLFLSSSMEMFATAAEAGGAAHGWIHLQTFVILCQFHSISLFSSSDFAIVRNSSLHPHINSMLLRPCAAHSACWILNMPLTWLVWQRRRWRWTWQQFDIRS